MLEAARERIRRLLQIEIIRQFVRYAMVGGLNVAIYFGIFNLMLWTGAHTLASNAVAFVFSSFNSFALNKLWAFKDRRHEPVAIARQYLVFIAFTTIGLALQTGALRLTLIPLERYGQLGKNFAALATLPVSVLWNFTTYRRWTFKPFYATPGA